MRNSLFNNAHAPDNHVFSRRPGGPGVFRGLVNRLGQAGFIFIPRPRIAPRVR